jgi:hypothetical protein
VPDTYTFEWVDTAEIVPPTCPLDWDQVHRLSAMLRSPEQVSLGAPCLWANGASTFVALSDPETIVACLRASVKRLQAHPALNKPRPGARRGFHPMGVPPSAEFAGRLWEVYVQRWFGHRPRTVPDKRWLYGLF